MALLNSLVSYWKMDEASGNCLDSVGGKTLAVGGTVNATTGKINNGRAFVSNIANYLRNETGITPGTLMSVSLWFKGTNLTQGNEFGFLFDIGGSSENFRCEFNSTNRVFHLVGRNGSATIGLYYGATGATYYTTYNDANWHHAVFIRNGATWKIYVDGTLHGQTTTGSTYSYGALPITIGRNYNYPTQALNGDIDEVGVRTKELSTSEVSELYKGGNGLTYPFNILTFGEYLGSGSGITKILLHLEGNSNDSSGNGINLTDDGTITYSLDNGRFGQGVTMTATSRIYNNSNLGFDGNSDCMFSLWFNVASWTVDGIYNFCGIFNGTTDNSFAMYYSTTTLFAGKSKRAVQDAPSVDTSTISTGVWHNIICVYTESDKQSYIYIDGLYRTKATVSGNGTGGTGDYIYLGDYAKIKTTPAKLDEYFYENRAWTPQEVKKYYTYAKGRFGIL